jgi:hypothetical protein
MSGLDAWLPEWDIATRHETVLPLEAERGLALTLGLPAGADLISKALLTARGLRSGISIERFFAGHHFEELERTPTTFVVGASGRPWLPVPELRPFAEAAPMTVRFAADIRTEPNGEGGCILSTETRVAAVDDAARRLFRCYWIVVGPLSGVLRKRWLRAAAERAARPARSPSKLKAAG